MADWSPMEYGIDETKSPSCAWLLDEDSGSHALVKALREACNDVERVVDVRSLGAGATDQGVFACAISQDRVLITKNAADFADIALKAASFGHPGILVLRYDPTGSHLSVQTIVRAIKNISVRYQSTRALFLEINQHVWDHMDRVDPES